MNKLAKRAWFTMILCFALILGLLTITVRYFFKASDWVTFQSSPHVYSNNGVMDCGTITDRGGTLLMDSRDGRSYADNETLRRAMLHLLGDNDGNITPALMQEYGDEMVGFDLINGTYNGGTGSGQMRLTLSAEVQKAAYNALQGYKGTVGVYNYRTGEILCMVSTPSFDPADPPSYSWMDEHPDDYDGVYINRFLHAAYAPGSTFKLVTAAAALETIDGIENRRFYCEGSCVIAGETVVCNAVHGDISFEQALSQSCNVVFAQTATELGAATLTKYAERIGITDSLAFDGLDTKRGNFRLDTKSDFEVGWAGVGQYTDQINPCQYMTYMGAIANGGQAASPYLVKDITFNGKEKYSAETKLLDRALQPETADALAGMMHYAVVNNYGEWYFSGLYAGAKSGTAERGEGQAANALFAGFTQSDDYPLAFVVVLEGGGSGSSACTPVVRQVLDACIVAMNNG